MKHIIPILVILLLLSSGFVGVSNTGEEQWVDAETTEREEYLKDIAFYYYDEYDSSKFEHYKEYFQRENSEIADLEELTTPVELPIKAASGGPMNSPWPMKCHDLHHTSRSPYSTANVTGLEKWRFHTNSWVEGGSIIDNEGTIYFGSFDSYLYAVYPDGTLKWKLKLGGWIWSTPAIAEDGTIYVSCWEDDKLYAVNSNGTDKWSVDLGGSASSSPAIAEDGTIYAGAMGPGDKGRINAINPNGTRKWYYDTGYWIVSDPAIGDDGTIYIGSGDSYLYAMYPNGTLRWRFKTGDIVKSHPSIADDGTIYFDSFDGHLYALYPNGTMKWKRGWGSGCSSVAIGEDGTLYYGPHILYAVYPNNGTTKWTFNLGANRYMEDSCPAISADGTIYVGTHIGEVSGGDIIAVNPDGTEKWRKLISDEWIDSSPCIAEDGTVYIGSQCEGHGYLHAFGPVESNRPPETPTITGETNGEAGKEYEYKLRVVDPDNNPISFYIEWGDETHTGWTSERASGENCYYGHTWSKRGKYTIRAKAKDTLGEESDWAYLEVTMPMNQQSSNIWFLQYLQNHPRMFPILRQLLGWYVG